MSITRIVLLILIFVGTLEATESTAGFRFTGGEQVALFMLGEMQHPLQQQVTRDGMISLPVGGTVNIKGKTIQEAIELMSTKVEKEYGLIKPHVSVAVLAERKRQAYIQGEVGRPQAIDLPNDRKLYLAAAIALAGGNTEDADYSQIKLIREEGGIEKVQVINGTLFTKANSAYRGPALEEGDVIVVPRAEYFAVTGKVEKPGIYSRKATGVLPGTPIRLSQAIAAAGGIKSIADPKDVKLIRTDSAGSKTVKVVDYEAAIEKGDARNDPVVEEGDQIVVTGSEGMMIFGAVKQPGVYYPFGGPMTIARLISLGGGFTETARRNAVLLLRKGQKGAPVTIDMRAFVETGDTTQNFELKPGDGVYVKDSGL